MVNRERVSLIDSSERDGRWLMSTLFSSFCQAIRYLMAVQLMHRGRRDRRPRREHYLE